jgi:quinol monooxygenase YgiN
MITITAVIRCQPGQQDTLRAALLAVAAHVQANEPETIGFFVSQAADDPCVFTTYERFADAAAKDRHNGSPAVATFFGIAKPILAGEVVLVTGAEVSAKA